MMPNFNKIKKHYKNIEPIIMETNKKDISRWVSPYTRLIDWPSMFSPIEMQTWMALRCFGHCPLYPQYPVGKYYTDFGNPYVKVSIECDGKEWHMDKGKDRARDLYFKNLGWTVFRISGNDCFTVIDESDLSYQNEEENIEILTDLFSKTIEGLIEAIGIFYFGYKTYNRYVNKYLLAFNCLANRISVGGEELHKMYYDIISDSIKNMPRIIKSQTLWV